MRIHHDGRRRNVRIALRSSTMTSRREAVQLLLKIPKADTTVTLQGARVRTTLVNPEWRMRQILIINSETLGDLIRGPGRVASPQHLTLLSIHDCYTLVPSPVCTLFRDPCF